MKILFLVARPTQFEAPFYRFAAGDPSHLLKPLFWDARAAAPVEDVELGRAVDWGFDLLAGYPHAVAPATGARSWIEHELDAGCDLLIVNGYTLPLCRRAARAARRRRVTTALRLDSVRFPGEPGPSLVRRVFIRHVLGNWFDRFLGTSSLTLEYLSRCGIARSRRGLFPYAVDHEHFRLRAAQALPRRAMLRAGWRVPENARVVLAVAKLHPRETPRELIAAVRYLPPDVHLIIAGDGPERPQIEALAKTTDAERVHLLGYVPYASLPEIYAASDVFVHVPPEERWGVSVAEALAAGLPVVTGRRVGAGYDLLREGANGFVVDALDPQQLARAVDRALALPASALASASAEALARWDYPAAWRSLLAAAG